MIVWPEQRENAERLRRRLLEMCNRRGVPVRYARELKAQDGKPAWGLANTDGIEIEYADVLRETSTLVHELAHQCLHIGPGAVEVSRRQEELEAETVAAVLLEAYGCGGQAPRERFTPRVVKCSNFLIAEIELERGLDIAQSLTNFTAALEAI